ncbi:nucleotidyltransferase family protein [Lachnospiraceae bacterium ZAX-1]
MNVVGIIAEYNPFHLGHLYQILTLRKNSDTDYIIVVMSGNFVQRGEPALMDKYTRAQMALLQGADLVLELPALYATASAELFALGGVKLLNSTGVATRLCFGAETNTLAPLKKVADILSTETEKYTCFFHSYLKQGLSFPAARAKALQDVIVLENAKILENAKAFEYAKALQGILASPNNILAVEYLKSIRSTNSALTPYLIQRKGSGYHDASFDSPYTSATAIRKKLFVQSDDSFRHPKAIPPNDSFHHLKNALPDPSFQILQDYARQSAFLSENDFSLPLHCKLLASGQNDLLCYADSGVSLSNRIAKRKYDFLNWKQFCGLLKTKEITYTRISRLLTHILLDVKTADYATAASTEYLPYLRVLGFKKGAEPLLSAIKKAAIAPLVTSVCDASRFLPAYGMELLSKDLYAADLYQSVLTNKTGSIYKNEYQRKMMVCDA